MASDVQHTGHMGFSSFFAASLPTTAATMGTYAGPRERGSNILDAGARSRASLAAFEPDVRLSRFVPGLHVNDAGTAADRAIFGVRLALTTAGVDEISSASPQNGQTTWPAAFGRRRFFFIRDAS